MSKQYETRSIPAREERTLACRKCDLCERTTKHWDGSWHSDPYGNVDETQISVTVRQREGSNWPEGGSGTEYEVDLCPRCFKEKLIPWLRSQGADIEQEDWDW